MTKLYTEMTKDELKAEAKTLKKRYDTFKARGLKLDMSRGKPGKEQLDLSTGIYDVKHYIADGVDVRNYGMLDGIPSCKELFGDLLDVPAENVLIGPNESLTLMFDFICQCYTHGMGDKPWSELDEVSFLCPVPGYDRHFTICEYFGINMINIPMTPDGPDMDAVEEAVKDKSVKGMLCVPKYSNPQGITFSEETVHRIAALKPAAKDFRIIWDNAYCVHDLVPDGDTLVNIFDILPQYGNEDMVVEVASTSKITFPGAGISCLAASKANLDIIRRRLNVQTISYDKMNQHRHVQFFGNADGIREHMKKHAAILKPKFDIVINHLNNEIEGRGIASWHEPKGGYFISFDVMPGCAKRIGELCKKAGVTLTTVGATYPYGIDPKDSNIRIAPTFPPNDDLNVAAEILCICTRMAAIEKLLG